MYCEKKCLDGQAALLTSDHEVLDLNLDRSRVQLMTVWYFIAQSFIVTSSSSQWT